MTKEEIIAIAIREMLKCGKESEEVTFQVQSVPGNRIGSEPDEHIAALEKEVNELVRICEEKDAKIADCHKEIDRLTAILRERDAEIAKVHYREEYLKSLPITKEVLELNGFEQRDHDGYLTNGYTHIRIASDDTAEAFDYSVEGEEILMCFLHSVLELDQFMKLREREEWTLKLPEGLKYQ